MAIRKSTRPGVTNRNPAPTKRRTVQAGTSITSNVRNRNAAPTRIHASYSGLTPEKQAFVRQLQANTQRHSILAATNTTNIAARPEFMELLPLFVQKLLILDVFGSVAMHSRTQMVPYMKVMAANTKGETPRGDILNSPFVHRQGIDPNFTGRVVKNEILATDAGAFTVAEFMYKPVLPGSVTIAANIGGVTEYITDNGMGDLVDPSGGTVGTIAYDFGTIELNPAVTLDDGDTIKVAAYQYDNETVGPDTEGRHGARMGQTSLQLDHFNLEAKAHQLSSFWSIYSAFASSTEWGASVQDMAKEAAFGQLTAEINSLGFQALKDAARYDAQFNWNAAPVLSGSVVPSDYLNMFKLRLGQASASVYQATRLTRPNRLIVGANVAEYIKMMNGFTSDQLEDTVGPYRLGRLDQFECYVEPNYDPNHWVMAAKSSDIQRNSALFGEYMPFTSTDAIGLADMSIQQGFATMFAMKVVNPSTVVSGKIMGI